MTDEGPYPSTVTGAVPFGAPVTVAWAAAGVATAIQSIAVADSAVINMKPFIGISVRLDRAAPTLFFQTLFHRLSRLCSTGRIGFRVWLSLLEAPQWRPTPSPIWRCWCRRCNCDAP
jgi:hypothetical protein